MADKEYEIMPSTLETIDQAFYTWLDETLDISATTNEGFKKVPSSGFQLSEHTKSSTIRV